MEHKDRFVAYDSDGGFEVFESFEQAQAWLREANDEGFSEETVEGFSWIGKITHRTGVEITDRQEWYHEHTEDCPPDCAEEEWGYDSEHEWVGKLIFVPVGEESTQ